MASTKQSLGALTNFTITLASLADASARESTSVDNSSNLFLDASIYLALTLAAGQPADEQVINIYFYSSVDGTNFDDNATGADAALTLRTPSNFKGPHVINCPDSGGVAWKSMIPSVAYFFNGILPVEWGIIVENQSGLAFDSTAGNHTAKYRGIFAAGT